MLLHLSTTSLSQVWLANSSSPSADRLLLGSQEIFVSSAKRATTKEGNDGSIVYKMQKRPLSGNSKNGKPAFKFLLLLLERDLILLPVLSSLKYFFIYHLAFKYHTITV